MLRDEEAINFVKKIQTQKTERAKKLVDKRKKEINDWNDEIDSRREYLYMAKERVHLERKDMSKLNSNFTKLQNFQKIINLPSIKKEKVSSNEKRSLAISNNLIEINQSLQDSELKLSIHYGKSINSVTKRNEMIELIKAKYFREVNNN